MTITEALLRLGDELKVAMTDQLKANKSYGTGELAKSISYEVNVNNFTYDLVRTMLTYGIFVDQGDGRRPGTPPPVQPIIDWIKLKKIPVPKDMTTKAFAFAIVGKIAKEGTDPKPRPFIAPSINKVLTTTGKELLSEAGIDTIKANIDNKLKDIKITA
jgi:hypothetical protein